MLWCGHFCVSVFMVNFVAGPSSYNGVNFDSIFKTEVHNLSLVIKVVHIQNSDVSLLCYNIKRFFINP